ncbi:hypothetical protein Hanom_Chr08g00731101 [Helianthus anomalus]
MFEGRNLRFTKDFRMCFVMNRLRLFLDLGKPFCDLMLNRPF